MKSIHNIRLRIWVSFITETRISNMNDNVKVAIQPRFRILKCTAYTLKHCQIKIGQKYKQNGFSSTSNVFKGLDLNFVRF